MLEKSLVVYACFRVGLGATVQIVGGGEGRRQLRLILMNAALDSL